MFRFGVRHLRRLEDVRPLELRPITILVGRNSSGKSTFLRALPLLRQSVTTRTSSPILWFGGWVDFGDFERSVMDNSLQIPICFSFGIDSVSQEIPYFYDQMDDTFTFFEANFKNVNLTASVVKSEKGTRLSSIMIEEETNDVTFELQVNDRSEVTSLLVNSEEMVGCFGDWRMNISAASIFPSARFVPSKVSASENPTLAHTSEQNPLIKQIEGLISPRLDKRTKGASLSRLLALFTSMDVINQENIAALAEKSTNQSWGKMVSEIGSVDRRKLYPRIRNLLLANLLPRLLNATSEELKNIVRNVLYIGPARAKSDRYYRYQDLAVSEIDPDGQNFPMFLNSLTDSQIGDFSKWVKSLFGYGVKVSRESGHITINLVYDTGAVNIVDTGYGVSQILPVLGQAWWANYRRRLRGKRFGSSVPLFLAIEQPELHLHPAHQAMLADAFVSAVAAGMDTTSQEQKTHFILETHSEPMINRFGALIADKKIDSKKIQVLVFDTKDNGRTEVTTASFDDDGNLVNWPYDFFLPTL